MCVSTVVLELTLAATCMHLCCVTTAAVGVSVKLIDGTSEFWILIGYEESRPLHFSLAAHRHSSHKASSDEIGVNDFEP